MADAARPPSVPGPATPDTARPDTARPDTARPDTPGQGGARGDFVHGDAEVLRVLAARRTAGSEPGARRDPHRVALVIGGGGMRGAYVAGMLRAVERARLTPSFDEVYGASSGSFTAAAFLTGDAAACAACYTDDLCTDVFINMRRLGTRRPVVALEHLVRTLETVKPMDWAALERVADRLHVVATDVADLTPHTLTGMSGTADWKRVLRASATIPLLAGPPVEWAGRRWVDGSVAEPLALARALRGGATHVLAVLCRGTDDLHPDPDAGLSLWARTLDRLVPGLGTVAQGSRRYGADLRLITDAAHPDRGPQHLAAIGPCRSVGVGGLTIAPGPIAAAVATGDESATAAFARFDRGRDSA